MLTNLLVVFAVLLNFYLVCTKQTDPIYYISKLTAKWLIAVLLICLFFRFGIQYLYMQGIMDASSLSIFNTFTNMVLVLGIISALTRYKLHHFVTWWWRSWSLLFATGFGLAAFLLCSELDRISQDIVFIITLLASMSTYFISRKLIVNYYAKNESRIMLLFAPRLIEVVDNFSSPLASHKIWCDILSQAFNPKTLESMPNTDIQKYRLTFEQPSLILDDGAAMAVLGFNGEVVLLAEASHSMRLFCNSDKKKVSILWRIISQTQAAQNAYLEGETNERRLIAEDLTEEIGKKLVHMISISGQDNAYARNTLKNLELLTKVLSIQDITLGEIIADINYYFAESCDIKSIQYSTDIRISHLIDERLSSMSTTFFNALLNELLRNALQNENTTYISLSIYCISQTIVIQIVNDGGVIDPAYWQLGLGIVSIKRRISDISGTINWVRDVNDYIYCKAEFNQDKWLNM